MYLVATLNDKEWSDKMKWKVYDFMTAQQLWSRFAIDSASLPRSSREPLKEQLLYPPTPQNLSHGAAMKMIQNTKFHQLCGKSSKRRKCALCNERAAANGGRGRKCNEFVLRESRCGSSNVRECAHCGHSAADHGISSSEQIHRILRIEPWKLKQIVASRWEHSRGDLVPVVVNKPKKTWIEWKQFIRFHLNGQWHSFAISLANDRGRWEIRCLDYDAGRIFYQHRLISEWVDSRYRWTYNDLAHRITTKLRIGHRPRSRR